MIAKANRESENILLMEQRQALVATQAVGARELSKRDRRRRQQWHGYLASHDKRVKTCSFVDWATGITRPCSTGFPSHRRIRNTKHSAGVLRDRYHSKYRCQQGFQWEQLERRGGAIININSKELVGDQALGVEVSGGINSEAAKVDFSSPHGTNY